MDSRESLLQSVRIGLANGTISAEDLRPLIAPTLQADATGYPQNEQRTNGRASSAKLSVVDVLFYLAGLVLYAALMVTAFQMEDGSPMRSTLLISCGLGIWTIAYVLGRSERDENRNGLTSALLLTGCLSLISGSGVVVFDLSLQENTGYVAALALVLLGGFHLLFDKLFRHMILVVIGMLLLVAAFPTMLSTMLQGLNLPLDVWALIGVGTGLLTAAAGYVASKTAPNRNDILEAFLSIAGFIVLGSAYVLTFEETRGIAWTLLFPLLIYGAFFFSIKRRSKNFLVTGSLFLVIFLITVAFRYFAGLGAAFCLALSAVGLLATAFMATAINKRYIKDGTSLLPAKPSEFGLENTPSPTSNPAHDQSDASQGNSKESVPITQPVVATMSPEMNPATDDEANQAQKDNNWPNSRDTEIGGSDLPNDSNATAQDAEEVSYKENQKS